MDVQLIERLSELDRLRDAWESAFRMDRCASVFVAWAWIRAWIEVGPHPHWAVLAARERPGQPYVAFLPVNIRGESSPLRVDQLREIHMAGDPAADYTGFVCHPDFETPAIEAVADHMYHHLPWDRLRLREVNDPRLEIFLKRLPRLGAMVREKPGTCCPYIPLPSTWEEFLQQNVSYESRKSLRKKIRLVERDCRLTHLNGENHREQIEALLKMAAMREYHDPLNLVRFRRTFRAAADAGFARVFIVWHGETPIAGMGAFVDDKACSLGFYLTAFDDRYADYSPGRVVNALAIQYAIEHKYRVLDFMRGAEAYKFQFGAQRRFTRNVTVLRRRLRTAARLTINRTLERLGI
jgi:CelD/BcsL family acetyltransferase involved in cellulose biosynthesis